MNGIVDGMLAVAPFVAIGFFAQLVDGALGMAFGVINSTLLVTTMGMNPAAASASVHLAETFTTAASGLSHVAHRNVDWRLFARLLVPGVIGGILGAYVLSNIDAAAAKPIVMTYLVAIGFYILFRAVRGPIEPRTPRYIAPLGLTGGFLDAAGGGGWGSVVTSNLLVQGTSPRMTVGTVNAVEFFLTATISATFIATIGWQAFTAQTLGILIGGVMAAPLGAYLVKQMPARRLMAMVGTLLIVTCGTGALAAWRGTHVAMAALLR